MATHSPAATSKRGAATTDARRSRKLNRIGGGVDFSLVDTGFLFRWDRPFIAGGRVRSNGHGSGERGCSAGTGRLAISDCRTEPGDRP